MATTISQPPRKVDCPQAASLLARIHRQFPTITQVMRFGSLRFPFTRIKEPDRVLDRAAQLEARGDQVMIPYWAELWESAIGIGQFLARREISFLPNMRVLDLGCGMGLAGTAAAAMGARVTLVDVERTALLFAQLNTIPFHPRTRVRQIDWRTGQLHQRFDLILGADLLYDRLQWPFLQQFWQAHLSGGGSILLGEPGRQSGNWFVDWLDRAKWKLEEFAEQTDARPAPIRIFRLASRA